MKMTTGIGYGALSCKLSTASDMSFTAQFDCGEYASDTIRYAVCRFLRKNRKACDKYVTMSYKMRFEKGKARRPKRCWFVAPAKALELPGASINVTLSVDPVGVTVESVSIYSTYHAENAIDRCKIAGGA